MSSESGYPCRLFIVGTIYIIYEYNTYLYILYTGSSSLAANQTILFCIKNVCVIITHDATQVSSKSFYAF